jgi:hypothetical protein
MNEKSPVRRTISTSTKTWTLDELPSESREAIKKMMASGKVDVDGLLHGFGSRSSGGDSKPEFVVEIEGEAIVVNGHRYECIDDVPAAERERVEALRASFAKGGSLMDIFDDAFGEMRTDGTSPAGADRPESVPPPATFQPAASGLETLSPGAVPRGSAMRRFGWLLLVVFCAVVAWLVVRGLNQP